LLIKLEKNPEQTQLMGNKEKWLINILMGIIKKRKKREKLLQKIGCQITFKFENILDKNRNQIKLIATKNNKMINQRKNY